MTSLALSRQRFMDVLTRMNVGGQRELLHSPSGVKGMVGVNDKAIFYCHKCKQKTEHETDWESEEPNSLYIVCTVCRTSRTV